MRLASILGWIFVVALILAALPARAAAQEWSRASKLSAALGGTLDSDIGEAGALEHAIEYSSVMLRPGRGVEYRQRVAQQMQMAARSTSDASRVASLGRD